MWPWVFDFNDRNELHLCGLGSFSDRNELHLCGLGSFNARNELHLCGVGSFNDRNGLHLCGLGSFNDRNMPECSRRCAGPDRTRDPWVIAGAENGAGRSTRWGAGWARAVGRVTFIVHVLCMYM